MENKYDEVLQRHTSLIADKNINKEENCLKRAEMIYLGEVIAAHRCNYKCCKCGSEKNLQIHHKITRPERDNMRESKKIKRYYYENITLLCTDCHYREHEGKPNNGESGKCISERRMNKLKDVIIHGFKKAVF